MSRDALFLRFVTALFILLLLYGLGMMVVALFGESALATRMVSSFGAMFAGILGLGSGYLLGRTGASPPKPPDDGPKPD